MSNVIVLPDGQTLAIPCAPEQVSDGFHSFAALYHHRSLLCIAFMLAYPFSSWKSRLHADGGSYAGWFVVGMSLPTGDITYHLPLELWDLARVEELEQAPSWDGHSSQDVAHRLET